MCLLLIVVFFTIMVSQIGVMGSRLGVIAVPVSGGVVHWLVKFLVVVFPSMVCTFMVRCPGGVVFCVMDRFLINVMHRLFPLGVRSLVS